MINNMFIAIVILLNSGLVVSTDVNLNESSLEPLELYEEGVKDYLDSNYDGCIRNIEAALNVYNSFARKLLECRRGCNEEEHSPLFAPDVENLGFYETTILRTLCVLKCEARESISDARHNFAEDAVTKRTFHTRKPYEYLHACYAHNNKLQDAANAAFTFLVVNPNHAGTLASLQFYVKATGVNVEAIINREAKDYVYLYVHGSKAYEEKRWSDVIANMETSLESFLHEEQLCRAGCEGAFDQGWNHDLIATIANHFTHALVCKRKCNDNLSTLNGEKHDDLLPSHYHYLQYAYFKEGKLKQACKAVASYLLFYPTDKTMMHNAEYYKTLPKVEEEFFTPRPEVVSYLRRNTYESKIFDYVMNVFAPEVKKLQVEESDEANSIEKAKKAGAKRFWLPKPAIKRFTMGDFITPEQCQQLVHIAQEFSVPGDGYQGAANSPHTIHENYFGLSLKRAAGLVPEDTVDFMLSITEAIKERLQDEFHVTKRLYYAYTHLVCRSAKADAAEKRTDFSHPVHADNCNVQPNGTCPKAWPAFTWRDYTAILYLNSDFLGGDFFFARDYHGRHIEETVRPECGRLVGFTSGSENLHGVQAIHQGRRCALAVWFTHEHKHCEKDHRSSSNKCL